jgi:hypothetical protein
MQIELTKTYRSGLMAYTDLHAGGLFFGIVYRHCFLFRDDGTVMFTKELVDAFRPMDEQDVKRIENYQLSGSYHYNDRGYLQCEFKELSQTYTGFVREPGTIVFHIYDSAHSRQWSDVFTLD